MWLFLGHQAFFSDEKININGYIAHCVFYHIYVTSPKEKDMGYNDETEELVKLLDAPVMDPGSWVSHWDADYAEAQ